MSKTFRTTGSGASQTLHEIEDEKIPVYDTTADAEADLANLAEEQIVATKDAGGDEQTLIEYVDGRLETTTTEITMDVFKTGSKAQLNKSGNSVQFHYAVFDNTTFNPITESVWTTIGTLPVGFRPKQQIHIAGQGTETNGAAPYMIGLEPTGEVQIWKYPNIAFGNTFAIDIDYNVDGTNSHGMTVNTLKDAKDYTDEKYQSAKDYTDNNAPKKLVVSTQGATINDCLKNLLDILSERPTNIYNGYVGVSTFGNGMFNAYSINNPDFKEAIGIVEIGGGGTYMVQRNQIVSNPASYMIRRLDLPEVSSTNNATKVDARFPSTTQNTWCYWWRCGRTVTVYFYADHVLSSYNNPIACYTGLPKPIANSTPKAILTWGGQDNVYAEIVVDNNGNLCTNGNYTGQQDVDISGTGSITYITIDD